jgi:acetyl-CoA carboxylase carboxyltransferase component
MSNALDSNYDVSHRMGEGTRRAETFFDAGTFVEIGAHVRRSTDSGEWEGIVTGYGAVDGKLVFAFFQDNSRMKGAIDAFTPTVKINGATSIKDNGGKDINGTKITDTNFYGCIKY